MSSFFVVMTVGGGEFSGTANRSYQRPFRLNGEWEMALTHLKMAEKSWAVYVFCDLVEYAYVDNSLMPFLDYCNVKSLRNSCPRYVKVTKKRFSSINVSMRRHPNYDDLTNASDVVCVLHFRKV